MSILKYFETNPKARDLAADLKNEYLSAREGVKAHEAQIAKLIAEPISRAEVMRIYRELVKDADREWAPELARRIGIVTGPEFEETGNMGEWLKGQIDPIAFIGTAYPANLAILSLFGDVLLEAIEKRVNTLIPASAKLTIAEKKTQIERLREKVRSLARQRDDALTAYRHLAGDSKAMIE